MRASTSINLLFEEHPFLRRFAAAKAAGFEGVEIQVLEEDAREAAAAAKDAGIEVALLNAPMGDLDEDGPGLTGVPGREKEFADAIRQAITSAQILGVHHIHVGPSLVPSGETAMTCMDCLARNLELALELADAADVSLLLEAMNPIDMPTALVSNVETAASIIRKHFEGRIGLQFDVYHVAQNGDDPVVLLRKHAGLIQHVQFSDSPGRGAPGTGTIDFDRVFSTIEDIGYDGWAGAEYHPGKPTCETLGWLPKYFRNHT